MRRWAALAWPLALLAQSYTPGPQVLTFFSDVDDSDQPYALYLPHTFDAAKRYPLVISLHGADSNHRLNLRRVFGQGNRFRETDAEASRYFPRLRDVEMIVASPQARGTMGFQGIAERDVYDVLTDVKRRFPIDEDRVYLTGLSMGGGGTLWLGLTRPDVWAAIAPVCPSLPPDVEPLAPNALNLPVRLFHGDQDPVVPVEVSRRWQKRLLALGGVAEYVEFPGVRHNSWDYAYRDAAIFPWFAQFRRNPMPGRVRFTSRAHKYSTAYWVRMDGLTPGTLASIDARFTAPNRVEVATSRLEGFTLNVAGHPQYSAARPLEVVIDGAVLRPRAPFSFVRAGGAWKPGLAAPAPEGPIGEAVSGRHIYVYGTADSPAADDLRRRREVAEQAAEWSQPPRHLSLAPAVRADRDIKDEDLDSASLFLFGTRETNRVIARYADRLPIAMGAGAADYGLLYLAPVGKHYVVVNSGLPYWTGADDADRGGYPYAPARWRLLSTFGDFILFRGSLSNVVAEGRFGTGWKLPAEAAAKMTATGAVTVR